MGLPRQFDNASAARQAARWRRNYFRLLFFREALQAVRHGDHIDRARAAFAEASGGQRGLAGFLRILRRRSALTEEGRTAVAALSPRGRRIFDALQKAIEAQPDAEGRGGASRSGR